MRSQVLKKNKIKSAFFQVLDILPDRWGYAIYHKVQKKFTAPLKVKLEANKRTATKVENLLKDKGGLKDKIVLEIGAGWMPLMPYFFKFTGGAKRVYAYDINEHYDNKYIDELNKMFTNKFNVDVRVEQKKYHLPSFVEYYPKSNVISSTLPDDIDLVFSRFVLEHVTPDDLVDMHKRFYKEFKDDVYILHLISPSDHRAYTDKSISHYDFLKYSQQQWDKIQTKFDYHNRMRLPQYLNIFEETGFEVVSLEYDTVDKLSEKFEKLAGSINVLLRKK